MNRTLIAFAALSSTLIMSVAQANDGTINFNGELTAQTCTTTVNGVANAATVVLPTLSTSALAVAGATAGSTNFTIELSNCSASIVTAAALFEAGSGVDPISKNVRNVSGSATGVQFQLLDSRGSVISAGDASQVTNTARTDVTANTAVLPYAVQYFASAATTPGTVVGSVTYSINYQ